MSLIEFDEPRNGLLVAGQFVVFYSRQLEKGKILGSGLIELGGTFNEFDYNTLPTKNQSDNDDEDEFDEEIGSANDIGRMRF
jgi:hypothetical protein